MQKLTDRNRAIRRYMLQARAGLRLDLTRHIEETSIDQVRYECYVKSCRPCTHRIHPEARSQASFQETEMMCVNMGNRSQNSLNHMSQDSRAY